MIVFTECNCSTPRTMYYTDMISCSTSLYCRFHFQSSFILFDGLAQKTDSVFIAVCLLSNYVSQTFCWFECISGKV